MWFSRYNSKGGFTFIELIIVITILSILAVLAIGNYGLATNKARVQIAMEDVVGLFDSGRVAAQADGSRCVGVWLGEGEPQRWLMEWNELTQGCDYSDPFRDKPLQWSSRLSLDSIEWERIVAIGTVPGASIAEVLFVFEPPDGRLLLWDPVKREPLPSPYRVCLAFSYDASSEDVLKKAINVVPITSKFDILATCGA